MTELHYKVERNYCKCHPETCCCNDWVVSDSNGEKISTHYKKEDAEYLVNQLNKSSKTFKT